MYFALLPPEINSALMYAGPGSGSLLGAAAAWDDLAAGLQSTASAYQSVLTSLTAGPWVGQASASMTAAAAPYLAWLQVTARQAEQTANQATAAAVAYETAFAETVPPPVVTANRTQLTSLIATNFFGQNLPAIAATEIAYAEMWAQDTGAMLGYAAAAAAATMLEPFSGPESSTSPGGLPAQAAAVTQAGGISAGNVQNTVSNAAQAFSAVPNALTGLASPAAAADPTSLLDVLDLLGDLSGIFVDPEIGLSGLTLDGILGGAALPYDIDGYYVGLHTDDVVSSAARIPSYSGPVPLPPVAGSTIAAGIGEASTVGALTVPAGWTTAAPAIRLATLSIPATAAAAEGAAGGAGSLFSQMALAGMAGRAMAATTGSGGGTGTRVRERVGGVTKRVGAVSAQDATEGTAAPVPAGGPITSIAAELRELASLRDAGILTDDEFTDQKRRLLAH